MDEMTADCPYDDGCAATCPDCGAIDCDRAASAAYECSATFEADNVLCDCCRLDCLKHHIAGEIQ